MASSKKKTKKAVEELRGSLDETRTKLGEVLVALAESVDTDEVRSVAASWTEQAADKIEEIADAAGDAANDALEDPKKRKKLLIPVLAAAAVVAVLVGKKKAS